MSLFPELSKGIRFFVDSPPIPQPRQRHAYAPKLGRVVNYITKGHPVHVYKQVVQLRARSAYQGAPLKGPLKVCFLFLMPRPLRLVWKSRAMPRVWAPAKGRDDFDNLCKSTCDALTWILWEDDGQIVHVEAMKMYASGDESPGTEILVEELT